MIWIMPDEPLQSHAQQFERAIATAFTCRSVIKYNSSLSEEQKNELLADIDKTVNFLKDRLIANASIEARSVIPPLQFAGIFSREQQQDEDEEKKVQMDETFRRLYRIYHTYLHGEHGKSSTVFVTRYNEVIVTINEIQKMMDRNRESYTNTMHVSDLLERIRGFATDLYMIFAEFAVAVSTVLQGKDFIVDTEEHATTPTAPEEQQESGTIDVAPLTHVYETHQHLNKVKGTIASRAGDATAFLIFLEEKLGTSFDRHDEIIAQLRNVARLLGDLAYLLSDYEQATAALLRPDSSA
jgi:hypothetical protein